MLKLGYKAPAEQFGPNELLAYGVLAEQVGLDSVWISDHFQPWRHNGGHAPFSLAWLGALGAKTSRVQMGTSVLTPTFRYHPSIVAHAFATLASMFSGRVALGIGTGESLNEVPSSGIVWPEQKERTARFKEAVDLIQKLWAQERRTFHGQYYKTESATIYDRPTNPVPVYVAGAGPFMAKFAGEVAQGFICTSGKKWDLYTDILLPGVNEGLKKAGRAQDSIDRLIEMKVSFDTSKARALNDTRFWGALALTPEEDECRGPVGNGKSWPTTYPLSARPRDGSLSDDPHEIVERIRPYVEMGFNHLVFHAPGPDQARFLELFATKVAPLLHKAFV